MVTRLETLDVGDGFAEIVATPADGFPRDADHCALDVPGCSPSRRSCSGCRRRVVEHEDCAALGAPVCRYRVTWDYRRAQRGNHRTQSTPLRGQIEAMRERLQSMFETASDLIGADEISRGPGADHRPCRR